MANPADRTAMKRPSTKIGKTGLELIDEAMHLLRNASALTLATYYAGTVPFILGFLYFWSDMSRNPFAGQHVAEASLAVAALFLWMKFCHALFARYLRAQITSEPVPRWTTRQNARLFI